MIVDLLDLSRIEAGKIELTPTSVVLSQLAGEVVEQLRPLATAKRQRLEVHTAERGLTIRGDRDRLSQVITNLVDNAIKYTPEEGSITVGIAREGPDRARLSVSDTGVGIPKEFLPKVFERFFRAAHLHESGSKGLGLGLSIVKSLVELHGGTISVESVVGRGTTFHLIIPLHNPGLGE
jgi:signal transduction histidine kinase